MVPTGLNITSVSSLLVSYLTSDTVRLSGLTYGTCEPSGNLAVTAGSMSFTLCWPASVSESVWVVDRRFEGPQERALALFVGGEFWGDCGGDFFVSSMAACSEEL